MINLLNKQRYFLIFVFIIAFSLRIGYAFLEKITSPLDADGYPAIGRHLAEGKGYRISDGPIENDGAVLWPPGYAFFLAIIYKIFGYNYYAVWIIQSIMGAFICILSFFIAKKLFERKVAYISAIISALCFNLVIYPAMPFSETLFLLLLLLCLIYMYKADSLRQNSKYLLAGILAGFSVLTRPIILASFLFFTIISFKKNIKGIILFLSPVILLSSLWIMRNYFIYKQLIPICSGMGEIFWDGHHLAATGEYIMPKEIPENFSSAQEYIKVDNLGYKRGLAFIVEHPMKATLLELRKLSLFFSLVRTDGWWSHMKGIDRMLSIALSLLFNLLIFSFGSMGIVFSYIKNSKYIAWIRRFIYIYILSLIPFIVASRYRLAIYPFMIIFASYGLSILPKIKVAFITRDKRIISLLRLSVFIFSLIILNSIYDLYSYRNKLSIRISILKTGISNPW